MKRQVMVKGNRIPVHKATRIERTSSPLIDIRRVILGTIYGSLLCAVGYTAWITNIG